MRRLRYIQITFFFARVFFSLALWELLLPRLGLRSWVSNTRSARLRKHGQQFRLMAISLGGVMIKVGQFLSSRVDVLPVEIITELAGLQDEVPPESFHDIRQVVEAELGMLLDGRFSFFDPTPLAAASLGQVHRAILRLEAPVETLSDDSTQEQNLAESDAGQPRQQEVVVKVQRPGISDLIQIDLAALRTVGGWLQRYPPIRRRANVPALLGEFRDILFEEVDYLLEGTHAETFASNFQGNPWVRTPSVIWSHTTRQVLTLEDVWGIKINDYDAIEQAGIDRAEVASRLLDLYLQQIFKHGFFSRRPPSW